MSHKQALEVIVGKHREALARSKHFKCNSCMRIMPSTEASHVEGYEPRTEVMKKLVPEENLASYVICKECARLPEETVFLQVEQNLVQAGLLHKNLKPLDAPGGHSPEHQKLHRRKQQGNGHGHSHGPGRG